MIRPGFHKDPSAVQWRRVKGGDRRPGRDEAGEDRAGPSKGHDRGEGAGGRVRRPSGQALEDDGRKQVGGGEGGGIKDEA